MTDLEAQAVGCWGGRGRGPHYAPDLRTFHLNTLMQLEVAEQEHVQVREEVKLRGTPVV